MARYHIRPGNRDIGRCAASAGNCPFGSDDEHYPDPVTARKAAEEKLRWQYDATATKKRSNNKVARRKKPNDPKVIGDDYVPHNNPQVEQDAQDKRYVDDNENPNMRHLDDPDSRYLGAQERSIRQSRLAEEDVKDAWAKFYNKATGLIEYETVDDNGDFVKYRFNEEGKLHSLNGFAYEDYKSKVKYYKGIVHSDEEDGPALVLKDDAGEMYIKYGLLHRQDGPAVVTPHEIEYWRHGLLHKTGGPAIVRSNGEEEYWHKGEYIRTVYPDSPKPPESFRKETKAWWDDEKAVSRAEYEKDNYI